ncbi:MAG: nitrogenase component 1 [Ignavibacteria bacterium]
MSDYLEKPRTSCALGGALATVNALPRTVGILHASVGCGGMASAALNAGAGYLGSSYCGGTSTPTSGISEKEIVFGGNERLEEQIKHTSEIIDADLFVVITGCTSEIVGDDVNAVVRDYNDANEGDKAPVILASGAGFKGDSLFGYDSVLQAIFSDYVLPQKEKKKGVVNIWGVPPAQDPFFEGNLIEIRRLLDKLDIKSNSFFIIEDSLENIKKASEAELNIVLSAFNGVKAAKTAEDLHGIPYWITNLPVGAKATEVFLKELGEKLGLDPQKIEAVVTSEKKEYYRFFNRIADIYSDIDLQRYSVIIGDINYSYALSKFVKEELGWISKLVVVTDQVLDEQKEELLNRFKDVFTEPEKVVAFETDTSQVSPLLFERWPKPDGSKYYRAFSPAFVIGSRLDKEFADSIGAGHLSVSYPVSNRAILNTGYTGFHGGLHLIEDIYTSILSAR